jgi:tetratricopeptide (TPR) repeat protein
MLHHPTDDDLESLRRDGFRARHDATLSLFTRHFLAECPDCGHLLRRARKRARRYDYDAAFAAAARALADFLAEGRPPLADPELLLAELAALPEPEQIRQVAGDRRFAHPAVVHRLLEASQAGRYDCPVRMLHLAHLGRLAAEGCTAAEAGSGPRLADLLAQSWRQYGNALRVGGRLGEAGEALDTALRFRAQGTGDPKLRASLLEQTASLRSSERLFDEAADLAEEAGRIYRELGERSLLAATMVQRAIAVLYAGEVESAVRLLNRAIPWIDGERDPHLLLAACHNLVSCYIDLGQPEQALSIYTDLRDLYRDLPDPLISLRAGWQQAQLLRDLGHLRAAEAALLQARQGFAERGLLYEAAMVSLDLAQVYSRLGAAEELERLVLETIPIFRSLEVDLEREALALSIQLWSLADQEKRALALSRFLGFCHTKLAERSDRGSSGSPGTAVPLDRDGST